MSKKKLLEKKKEKEVKIKFATKHVKCYVELKTGIAHYFEQTSHNVKHCGGNIISLAGKGKRSGVDESIFMCFIVVRV